MAQLTLPPRPRTPVRTPDYPRLSALAIAVALSACGGEVELLDDAGASSDSVEVGSTSSGGNANTGRVVGRGGASGSAIGGVPYFVNGPVSEPLPMGESGGAAAGGSVTRGSMGGVGGAGTAAPAFVAGAGGTAGGPAAAGGAKPTGAGGLSGAGSPSFVRGGSAGTATGGPAGTSDTAGTAGLAGMSDGAGAGNENVP